MWLVTWKWTNDPMPRRKRVRGEDVLNFVSGLKQTGKANDVSARPA